MVRVSGLSLGMEKDQGDVMSEKPVDRARQTAPEVRSSRTEIDQFLDQVRTLPQTTAARSTGPGRLMFALDATASRQPAWNRAMTIQAEMFQEAAALGGLSMQVAFYRGLSEFRASPWTTNPDALLRAMTKVRCQAGFTQIERILRHATRQARQERVNALVFVGDSFEEDLDPVTGAAGELGLLGVPAFMFHEGVDSQAGEVFAHVARLTGGACCRFDANSPDQLRQLLRAVAAFAAGGRGALERLAAREGGMARLLLPDLRGG